MDTLRAIIFNNPDSQLDLAAAIEVGGFWSLTLGFIVFFAGARLTARFAVLRTYSIPEPVSGGLLAAMLTWLVVMLTGAEVEFELEARDALLVYFFTTVGLNARVSDLVSGGRPLALMLILTIGYMAVQNGVGMLGAMLFGMPQQAGVLMGTAALIGGHGTAIAWGPVIGVEHGVTGAAELGIASATMGLIMASLLGGPIAKHLIERRSLRPSPESRARAAPPVGSEAAKTAPGTVTHVDVMRSLLAIHLAIAIGVGLYESLEEAGLRLPMFVPCLLSGILLSNTLPRLFPSMEWPARTPGLSLVAELSLAVFLSMSLMSMELWTLAANAGPLFTTMALQAGTAVLFILFIVFPAMGRDYFAAVIAAGFTGVTLGATPTAIANMDAVTRRYGPAPLAFIVLPLVSAFFVDIANAFIITVFLDF